MKKISTIAILIASLYSCAKKMTPTKPTEIVNVTKTVKVTDTPKIEEKTVPAVMPAEKMKPTTVTYGKETFKAKCGKCHELKAPETYTAAKWVKIVEWMAPRAKLDQTEKDNLLAYVSYYAKTGG